MQSFLESEFKPVTAEQAAFYIIPAPLELSVSYGSGTRRGPQAIIEASQQLEAYNGQSCPGTKGIFTAADVQVSTDPVVAIDKIKKVVKKALEANTIPIILGGEHTVTLGAIEAILEQQAEFGVVQFDAHADLRESYENSKYSHACVAKRIFDKKLPIMQLGVRAISYLEDILRQSDKISFIDAKDLAKGKIPEQILPDNFPKKIYITFDIDSLDAGIMPATGTPEPGGLQWFQTLEILKKICKNRKVIGFDVVELAPIEGLHYCEYTAARLVYEIMGII